jgi:hypothetical protein
MATVTWLVDTGGAWLAGYPKTSIGHELSNGFLGDVQAVDFAKLLARQGRFEVVVAISDQTHGYLGQVRW